MSHFAFKVTGIKLLRARFTVPILAFVAVICLHYDSIKSNDYMIPGIVIAIILWTFYAYTLANRTPEPHHSEHRDERMRRLERFEALGAGGGGGAAAASASPALQLSVPAVLHRTQSKVYTANDVQLFYEKECTICMNEYERNSSVRALACGHTFHDECINKWFRQQTSAGNHHSCVICKARVTTLGLLVEALFE